LLLGFAVSLTGCVGIPADVPPVEGFKLDGHLGAWYEIARRDHRFERGLESAHDAWAMVCGPTRDFLWLPAREPRLDRATQAALIDRAQALGFDTAQLIIVMP
jgi:lipocalin